AQREALALGDLAVHRVHLGDDLRGGEVAEETQRAGHAELARHCAADLGGGTESLPVSGGHVDALPETAVPPPAALGDGSVGASLVEVVRQRLERATCAARGPPRLRQVGHLVEVGHATLVDPPVELPRVERTLPELVHQEANQAIEWKTQKVDGGLP